MLTFTKRLVVNKCCGGFGLSDAAHKWLVDRNFPADDSEFLDANRDHDLLVQVVSEMGPDSWGKYSELRVVDVTVCVEVEEHENGSEDVRVSGGVW